MSEAKIEGQTKQLPNSVPYIRFKEVLAQRNALRDENAALKAALKRGNTPDQQPPEADDLTDLVYGMAPERKETSQDSLGTGQMVPLETLKIIRQRGKAIKRRLASAVIALGSYGFRVTETGEIERS